MAKKRYALVEQIKGRWREFRREPSALFFVVFMPILWMLILGFAFAHPRPDVFGVGWPEGNDAAGALAGAVKARLATSPQVRLRPGAPAALATGLKRGEIQLIVRVDANVVRYELDTANKESTHAREVVNDLVQRAAGRADPILVVDQAAAIAGTRYIDFLVPGLLALSIMTSSLFGTGMTLVSNRRENLLKRYLATPMRPFEYIASHLVGRGFVLVVELASTLIAAALIFRFRVDGPWLAFGLFAALGAAAFTALAMLCGSRTTNMAAMNGMTNLISLPMMIVSGVWFSRVNFPDWMASLARALPLTALVDGLRRIALEGAGLADLGFETAVLGGYLLVCTVAARILFKWY